MPRRVGTDRHHVRPCIAASFSASGAARGFEGLLIAAQATAAFGDGSSITAAIKLSAVNALRGGAVRLDSRTLVSRARARCGHRKIDMVVTSKGATVRPW